MVKIGYRYAFLFFVLSAVFFIVSSGCCCFPAVKAIGYFLGGIFFVLTCFCFYFFRDPKRVIIEDEKKILSPADGTVFEISETDEPCFIKGRARIVKIFLSVFNVHVQRAPVAGEIVYVEERPGLVLKANHPDAASKNRQNIIGIKSKIPVTVKQIAGIIAQRCDLWVGLNQKVEQGEHIGVIHFGSQVDIYFPVDVAVNVKIGDKVAGGITVIGEIRSGIVSSARSA
jgi:phosphatidylserine decarboxylase